MRTEHLKLVFLGSCITSTWQNGHATTYRGLVRSLADRGHQVLFLERDLAKNREHEDLGDFPGVRVEKYLGLEDLSERFNCEVGEADLVLVGSGLAEGAAVSQWVQAVASGATAFYDLETPHTLTRLGKGEVESLTKALIPKFSLYLSTTGGPILDRLKKEFHAPLVRTLYPGVDPKIHCPQKVERPWDLGFLGDYSSDRKVLLCRMLLEPAARWNRGEFVVAGAGYSSSTHWPGNVQRQEHLPVAEHRSFYTQQKFTLNITRPERVEAGYSPCIRLFEAAACGTPVITDYWEGLDNFFELGEEILVARSGEDVLNFLMKIPASERQEMSSAARRRIMKHHTWNHRANELEGYIHSLMRKKSKELASSTL